MTAGPGGRTCARTGFRLTPVGQERAFRVAKPKYGPLSAPDREAAYSPDQWGRYDTPGRTLYVASDRATAYAEVLSPFKRQFGVPDPLEKDAAALGLTREDLLEVIAQEWQEARFMGVGAVPRGWRTDRAVYEVYAEGDGWLIDVEHPDSIAALEAELTELLAGENIRMLTTAVLRGENRRVTTAVGGLLRRMELDDGTEARGIHFGSKFGGGWCRAFWLPKDTDTWSVDLLALSGEPILVSDEHLARASERFRIRVF